VKRANFDALKEFARHYTLLGATVVSSAEFAGTAATGGGAPFPIAVALYAPCHGGMDWDFARRFPFRTDCGRTFRAADFTPLSEFVTFYPNAAKVPHEDAVAHFHTLRDINALRRNRAFTGRDGPYTIRVTRKDFAYYNYAAEFKRRIRHVPYYLGNFPVFVNPAEFDAIRGCFESCEAAAEPRNARRIDAYFRELLGEHFVE